MAAKKRKGMHHHEDESTVLFAGNDLSDANGDGDDFVEYRDDLLSRVPESVKSRFLEGGFCKWGKDWLPVLELGPFDVEPGGPVRDMWLDMFEKVS
mmetsp:Transcript_35208/g.63358  ORF Transcript_35208/g.63358 Transcript_35208/m.63358 type:complete len:96 (-) Transcript_35208:912-1199(-)